MAVVLAAIGVLRLRARRRRPRSRPSTRACGQAREAAAHVRDETAARSTRDAERRARRSRSSSTPTGAVDALDARGAARRSSTRRDAGARASAARRFADGRGSAACEGELARCSRVPARRAATSALVVAPIARGARRDARPLLHEFLDRGPLALLLASLAGYALAAAALRPVEAMRAARLRSRRRRRARLPVPPARDEISRLATTLNDMLARLEAAFEHERRFVADASHELRTPLALLRTELELALRRPRSHARARGGAPLGGRGDGAAPRLAEDLLLIARAEQGAADPPRATCTPTTLLDGRRIPLRRRAASARPRARRRRAETDARRRRPTASGSSRRSRTSSRTRSPRRGRRRARRRRDATASSSCTWRTRAPGFPPAFARARVRPLQPCRRGRGRGGTGLGLAIVA